MDSIRNYLFVFTGNFAAAYFIFSEGTLREPLMFAVCMLLLMLGIDYMKSKTSHALDERRL
ncbi:hypothetical protein [Paenibacillus sp. QZ-Y1]|uniref:hypothetical protein n=1 Tax=Paenibacillus sp. QZ-Y1 TaxID=3414511 RepID=UPI003F7A18B9